MIMVGKRSLTNVSQREQRLITTTKAQNNNVKFAQSYKEYQKNKEDGTIK